MRSDRTLRRWYKDINARFFLGELPDNVCVRWADEDDVEEDGRQCEDTCFGWADRGEGRHVYQIAISKKKNPALTAVLATLVHEMVHVRTALKDDHGPVFEGWRKTLSNRGIFKKSALVQGLTLF
jgi:hypothetical protein